MRLVFLYGPVASGKLTIARMVAQRTGMALFHNHLVVDAVAAVFAFGSPDFIRLREQFWLETIASAARAGRSLVFTFAPEPTVAADFPERLCRVARAAGGEVVPVALSVTPAAQERRLVDPARAAFGKLRSPALLRELRDAMDACLAAMPPPVLCIDTDTITAEQAAEAIVALLEKQG